MTIKAGHLLMINRRAAVVHMLQNMEGALRRCMNPVNLVDRARILFKDRKEVADWHMDTRGCLH